MIQAMVRVRFAPSPTGWIHIGNMRTVLFGYLFAKQQNGAFILRIEDTDQKRKIPNAIEGIQQALHLMGMEVTEGVGVGGEYGPYIQSERLDIYKKYADELVEKGHAYKCFCTAERLTELRASQKSMGKKEKYDGKCRNLSLEEIANNLSSGMPYVIRMKVPDNELIEFEDVVYGKISFKSEEVEDQILMKSDGFPTYHFAVVVDDHLMKITHIVRGDDWISSTPKHVLLYKYFGWEMPAFVHVPNVLNADRIGKLSKRKGAVSTSDFIRRGYLKEGIINFLSLLGWNPDPKLANKDEMYSEEFLVKNFDIHRIRKSGAALDVVKLEAINAMWINHFSDEDLYTRFLEWNALLQKDLIADEVLGLPEDILDLRKNIAKIVAFMDNDKRKGTELLNLVKPRMKKLSDVWDWYTFYFEEQKQFDIDSITAIVEKDNVKALAQKLQQKLSDITTWDQEVWEPAIRSLADENGLKHGDLFMILRVIVTGRKISPPLREVMVLFGREFVFEQFTQFIASL